MYIAKTDSWYLERITILIAGIITISSIVLTLFHSIYWLTLTGYVGINLTIWALTGFCTTSNILYLLGAKPRLQKARETIRGEGI
jgi:hypothetical protein